MESDPILAPVKEPLPDGWYHGKWSGYRLILSGIEGYPHGVYFKTKRGVRGINCEVIAQIEGGELVEESIEPAEREKGE